MIAKLRGMLDSAGDGWGIVDVGGVGYLVFCSGRTLDDLPGPGKPAVLLIETVVREDHIHFYGFASGAERDWFRALQTVQSVGARVALAVLSVLSPDELVHCLAAQERSALVRAAGVGPKLADRILAELKNKVPSTVVPGPRRAPSGPAHEAVSALVNLGYRQNEAQGAIAMAAHALGGDAPIEALIKAGLKDLAL